MEKLKLWVSRLALPLFILVLAGLTVYFHRELWDLFKSRDHLKELILDSGFWGPLFFIGLQILQVVVAVIPGELTQLAGGWIYGTWMGSLYSIIGITIGSIFNFYVARVLGTAFVAAVAGKKNLEKFEAFINTPRIYEVLFLLYLIPGMVKDVLAYIAGLSRMKLWGFLAICVLGRLPSLVVSSYMGESFGDENWLALWISGGLAVVLFTLGFFFRNQIQGFVGKMVGSGPTDVSKDQQSQN